MTLTIDLADPSHDTDPYRYITQPAAQISCHEGASTSRWPVAHFAGFSRDFVEGPLEQQKEPFEDRCL